jgi:hypothetical protein
MKPKNPLLSFKLAGWNIRFPGQASYYAPGRTIPDRCVELSRYDTAAGKLICRWIIGVSEDAINEYKRIYNA